MNPVVSKARNGGTMVLLKCAICGRKKSRFIKKQEEKVLLSNLGLKIPLSKIPVLGDILNKFLLAGDKFMSQMHLKQLGFTYSAYGPFTKNKERIKKFKETGDTKYIYRNELGKACFHNDIAYGDFKDLARRTASDKVLRAKAFSIAKNPKCDGYQRGLPSMVYKFFDKKTSGTGVKSMSKEQLEEDLHKPIIRKFKKRKVYTSFKDNIWGDDLADMQSVSEFNKGFRFLLCVIDIFSKYAWIVSLKDKKGVAIVNASQSILKNFNKKPNKMWVDKCSEFYNSSF